MPRKKRKIGFYYLTVSNKEITASEAFNQVINHINELERANRRLNLGNNKFCLLDDFQHFQQNKRSKILFKSATHSFRPNLIHRETITERESPKQLQEGETQKTHLVTKSINGELVFLMEKHLNGIGANQFIKYLNHFLEQIETEIPFLFSFEIMVKDNFLDEIELLNRVTCAEVFIDKQLLGSDALDYSNRINQVKHEVVLTVKAKNKDTIEDFARDVYAKFNGGENVIRKIRIIGRNEENNEVIINTDFIERLEYIMPEINEVTGELSSLEVFQLMNAVIQNFN
jgi:hypothetical protein